MTEPRLVTDAAELRELIARHARDDSYALDTEFHRERTYFPQLALVQLGFADEVVLVDPLVVDPAPLASLLEGPGVAVLHAADQDLEVLAYACGTVPRSLFDTQIAAGFLGFSSPSLVSLLERVLEIRVPKEGRLTDWLGRPLTATQLAYAAADVEHLLKLRESQIAELRSLGRLGWAEDECEFLRARSRDPRRPEDAWRRIKETRNLRPRAQAVAQEVAAWRERRAAETDQPPRFVLPDLAVVGIAERRPQRLDELRRVRGLDERHLRDGRGAELLDVLRRATADEPSGAQPTRARGLDRRLRPAVALVSAWVSQLARDLGIDTALLATRADIEAFLMDDDDSRLAVGWRAELVGEPVRRLVAGEAALAFDGKANVLVEERSRRPLRLHGPDADERGLSQ